jgi:predicted dehydrogenase
MSEPLRSSSPSENQPSRRNFLKTSTAAVAGGSLAATLAAQGMVHAAGDDTLKVALVGCGGRGNGAAQNAVNADPNAKLTVLCDIFPDQLERSKNTLSRALGNKFAVTDDRCFTGFDGYKQVMETDVDVVLLCTTPHFRPAHLKAAVDANKHIFCEKPIAVDAPGVRSVLATSEEARKKKLSLVSGLCWRYDYGVRETMDRIKNGDIGDIVAIQENYLTGVLWHRGRKPDWSEMEYQIRNWLYFTWLSGDHIVEQFIHSLDKSMWLMNDEPPVRCFGLGGRQVRTDEMWGHIYDHFAVCYEWANGVKSFAYTRQMASCDNEVEDYVLGTKGRAKVLAHEIEGANAWKYPTEQKRKNPSMYDIEHIELFASIRAGQPINNGVYMSQSTLMAIMGREACYTGRTITWEQMLNSEVKLGPESYQWGDGPKTTVAMPGQTKFA